MLFSSFIITQFENASIMGNFESRANKNFFSGYLKTFIASRWRNRKMFGNFFWNALFFVQKCTKIRACGPNISGGGSSSEGQGGSTFVGEGGVEKKAKCV